MHGKLTEKFSERGRKERNEFAKLENGKKKKKKRNENKFEIFIRSKRTNIPS